MADIVPANVKRYGMYSLVQLMLHINNVMVTDTDRLTPTIKFNKFKVQRQCQWELPMLSVRCKSYMLFDNLQLQKSIQTPNHGPN